MLPNTNFLKNYHNTLKHERKKKISVNTFTIDTSHKSRVDVYKIATIIKLWMRQHNKPMYVVKIGSAIILVDRMTSRYGHSHGRVIFLKPKEITTLMLINLDVAAVALGLGELKVKMRPPIENSPSLNTLKSWGYQTEGDTNYLIKIFRRG